MPGITPAGFLDQTIGRLVYAILPLNVLLTIGHGASSLEFRNESAFWMTFSILVILLVFWGMATVRLVARRCHRGMWRLIVLTPPAVILIGNRISGMGSIAFLVSACLTWSLASSALAFWPAVGPRLAGHGK